MNCPELSNGLYTTEEVIEIADADYKVYDLEKAVEEDIKKHANTEEFVPVIEEQPKHTIPADLIEAGKKEPVPAAVKEPEIPDFMKQEEM